MKTSDFDYQLPSELIAQEPIEPRDASRLLVLDRKKQSITHGKFRNLSEFLNEGDCLVINNTRVLPARLKGQKYKTGGKAEVLLLRQLNGLIWEALVKPGRRLQKGARIVFGDGELVGLIEDSLKRGKRVISFECKGDFFEILHRLGEVPLPPYVHKPLRDEERYQTIFAWGKEESVAAPTAGLHFTPSLIEVLKVKGVRFAEISLSIGLDTFRPIATELVENHKIHTEYFKLGKDSAEKINNTIIEGKRVIAVGTTSVRVLETVAEKTSEHKRGYLVKPKEGWTDLFIYPGYKFKIVDTLITNFHLPRSSLLLLVCAFAKKNLIFKAYNEAIEAGYRFFSFGDAMLIV